MFMLLREILIEVYDFMSYNTINIYYNFVF